MSYESVTLALNPILYLRLDEVGPDADGAIWPDISGNGLNAVQVYANDLNNQPPSTSARGQPSPIETDAGSRGFMGWGDSGDTSGGRPSGSSHLRVPNDSLLQITGDFTVEEWLRPLDGAPAFPGVHYVQAGKNDFDGGDYGIGRFGAFGEITGFCRDSANTMWAVFSGISSLQSNYFGTSHFYAVVRLGNALALYVDGQLRDQVTITSGLPNKVSSDPFIIQAGTAGYQQASHDEVAVFDYALSGPQILTQYEAALNTLHSSATITVRVPVTLDTDSIELLDFPFTHSWADPISGQERVITEHLSWKTLSNRSEPDYHQRIGARSHGPLRQLEYAITPTTPRARTALQRALWQPAQFYKLPIATDWVELTAQANPSDTTIDCDTTLRDFEVGGYVTVWRDMYNPASAQTFRITSVSDTQLGVSPVVASTFPIGSQLMPARLACLPDEDSTFDSYAIDLESGALRFEILSTELSTRRVTGYTPTSTHESIEVFNLDSARFDILDQTQYRIQRRQLGTGLLTGNDYYRAVDTLAPVTIPVRVLLVSRETLSEFYGWLEARQGRRNPVWVASADNDLELVQRLSTTQLKTIGYADYNLHYGRRHIQLVYADGSATNRKITAMIDNGDGTETLTVAALPAGTIAKISLLRLCVAPDSFELRFHRDLAVMGGMIVECAWEFSELLTTP